MFDPEYTMNFIELFIFCKNEENFEIFAETRKKMQRNKNDNSKCFYAQKHITLEREYKDII